MTLLSPVNKLKHPPPINESFPVPHIRLIYPPDIVLQHPQFVFIVPPPINELQPIIKLVSPPTTALPTEHTLLLHPAPINVELPQEQL